MRSWARAAPRASSPLLEDVSIAGAEGVLVNITGGRDLTLHEVNEAAGVVVGTAGEDANVIFGAVIDPNMDGEIQITVVATGFGRRDARLTLVETKLARASAGHVAGETATDDENRQKPAWMRHRDFRPSRSLDGGRGESREVPAFLRKQMD